jgi:hypothetical protein
MKSITITLDYHQYTSIRSILRSQKAILEKKQTVLTGTKLIRADLIACSLVEDRNKFLYETEKAFERSGVQKNITFHLHEIAALSYFLGDIVDLPQNVYTVYDSLKELIKPYGFEAEKTPFQIYYEENLMEEWGVTFTELRDEMVTSYNFLLQNFNTAKNGQYNHDSRTRN